LDRISTHSGRSEKLAVGTCVGHTLSNCIVRPAKICHGLGQDIDLTAFNELCSGTGKRKLSERRGRWWPSSGRSTSTPRRPWSSTVLARRRLQRCRQAVKDKTMNDKFNQEQLHWAKEGHIVGVADSRMQEVASRMKNNITSIINVDNTMATSLGKPGGSAETAKEIPGKHPTKLLSNILLPGQDSDRGGEKGHEVQHQGTGAVQDQDLCGAVGQQQCDVGEDEPGHVHDGVGRLDAPTCSGGANQMGQGGEGGGLEQHPDGAGDEGGRGARVRDGGVVQRLAQSFTERLRHPEEGVSPGYVKSRRKRKPDGLVQSRIYLFTKQEKNVPSAGLNLIPSGGPWEIKKNERGFKRGLGDQTGGPIAVKRLRKD
jgi:hypothetical protein